VESRVLAPGQRASFVGGISFTVPEGWVGLYTRYVDVPDWIPFSDARLHPPRQEQVDLRHNSSSDDPDNLLVGVTYARGGRPGGASEPVVATAQGVKVHASEDPTATVTTVEVARSGLAPVYLFIHVSGGDVLGSVRRIWKVTAIKGAATP
jgi:hypothetical protein